MRSRTARFTMPSSAVVPFAPAPARMRCRCASRLACRRAAAAAVCLLVSPVWSVPVQLTELRDRPLAAFELSAEPSIVKPEPATTPLLDHALSSIEPGTVRLFDETLANERGNYLFEPTSDQAFARPMLSQRSYLLLSRVLLAQPPAASPVESGNETAPVEPVGLSGDLGRPAGLTGPQWSGGGLGGNPFLVSAGADAGDARTDAPAQADPFFSKLLPALDYVRENRYRILAMIAALLVVGGYLARRLDRR